ncbi:hypothetical protein EGI16_15040 [Chryseobacterium sp. G0240]|uniref:hypothetical protein n=1 Tax=Chryseobacterium sp. G0240 TaxID=2487066 RepID=UPI000F44FF62|nr:hypothetical protein [Chryseobacterium sp. G0240]ROI02191.1 hypothetical protein EGI16_15040 [Chryseobacterium sp. G0240]
MIGVEDTSGKISVVDYFIFSGALIFIILKTVYSSGELTPDSIQYLLQAQNLWGYKVNFPLGYPFLIKIVSFVTGSLLIASKVINILAYLGTVLFSYRKKFFLSQTILIFSFYPFINLYSPSLSEPLYFFINYLIIYYVYQYIKEGFTIKNTVHLSLLFFFLVSVRFSGVFVLAAVLAFLAYFNFKNKYPAKSFIIPAVSVTVGALAYLIINHMYSGFALGRRDHLYIPPASLMEFMPKMLWSALNDFSFLNTILHKGILNRITSFNIFIGTVLFILFIFLIVKKRKQLSYFNVYLIFSFIIITLGILYSYYTTGIDNTIRIKSNAYLYMIFFIFLNSKNYLTRFFQGFVIFSLLFNCLTIIKYAENIISYLPKFSRLICPSKDKIVYITYKDIRDEKERNHSSVLFFKAYLIDKGYSIEISDDGNQKAPGCHVTTSEIINRQ